MIIITISIMDKPNRGKPCSVFSVNITLKYDENIIDQLKSIVKMV